MPDSSLSQPPQQNKTTTPTPVVPPTMSPPPQVASSHNASRSTSPAIKPVQPEGEISIAPPGSIGDASIKNKSTTTPTSSVGQTAPPKPSVSGSASADIPQPTKPPAVVTALHSVMPSGIPAGANQLDESKAPTSSTTDTSQPTLDQKVKVESQAQTEVGKSAKQVGGHTQMVHGTPAKLAPSSSAPPPPPKVKSPTHPSSSAKPVKPKSSILAKLPYFFGGLMLILLALVAWRLLSHSSTKKTSQPTTIAEGQAGSTSTEPDNGRSAVSDQENIELEYWGLWEPEVVMQPIIQQFETEHPGVSIRYVKQSPKNYRERLQTAIASGNGPDVFRYHATWVPMLADDLAPIPATIMSASEFQQAFYPVANAQLQSQGQLVGLPVMYDGLMLFYNKDILQAAGESPPSSWAQLRSLAVKLTLKDGTQLKRAGVALGTADNTDHFSDILATLMLQNGADLTQPDSPEVRDALIFYTNFVTTDKVWNQTMPNSVTAFARGEAAMILAPSWRAEEIRAINPELKFATAPMPQVTEDNYVTWASYWAEGVNKHNKHTDVAWQFLKFLTTQATEKQLFAEAAKTRLFGEPYSRVDLQESLAEDEVLGSLMADAPKATSWYMCSNTFDNGINDQIIKYYVDAVNAVLAGKDVIKVLPTLSQGVSQVLLQYNVNR